jgi:hypothetical protein
VILRSSGPPMNVLPAVRELMRQIDPGDPTPPVVRPGASAYLCTGAGVPSDQLATTTKKIVMCS